MKSIIYIGMDVHKNTYSLCGIHSSTGEIIAQTKCGADVENILKFIDSAKERLSQGDEMEIVTGYEAGCLGFSRPPAPGAPPRRRPRWRRAPALHSCAGVRRRCSRSSHSR